MTETINAWDKRPSDTAKSYKAFRVYLLMVDHANPKTKRSLVATAEAMGYAVSSNVEAWSTKHDWVARAEAYDNYMQNRIIAIRETSIVEYQKQVITELTAKTAMVDRAIENLLVHSDILEPIDVLRLVNAIKTNDNLKRRAAQLPTTYRTSYIDEPDNEEFTYVLGDD